MRLADAVVSEGTEALVGDNDGVALGLAVTLTVGFAEGVVAK